ncbi:hypothetical protein BH10BAC3_BH10BAC3_01380 [soil metagenome]
MINLFIKRIIVIVAFIRLSNCAKAQMNKDIYLFSYFKDNGQDGLHLAFSED